MSATTDRASAVNAPAVSTTRTAKKVGLLGTLVLVAGVILGLSGAGTWALVQTSLADERITVAEDAERFGGQLVNGPLTAYYQADIIETHALTASDGKTYAELDREDPVRATVRNGSFLRASLFTSVVSFGIAAMTMGLGIVFILIGIALRAIAKEQATA
ncbi:MAG: aromatic ring-opening dioxygenase LigA [Candidatus Limnocylindrales bacterium]